MDIYSIFSKKSVEKDLATIPNRDISQILTLIKTLSDNPRPAGCEKLSIEEKYRLQQGDYRLVYSIKDKAVTVWIIAVKHRKDVYRSRI